MPQLPRSSARHRLTRNGRMLLAAALLWLPLDGHPAAAPTAALISIVIDDLGNNAAETRAAIDLPGPVACAFLPEAPYTRQLARLAHGRNKEVLVHLPLEPVDVPRAHPLALTGHEKPARRDARLAELLAAVPDAVGVNNHQGSEATADRSAMRWLMRSLSMRDVGYFVDSRTTPRSVAYNMARAFGIPSTRRRVFLDYAPGEAVVRTQFRELLRLARRNGAALAIGHPHPETLRVLAELLAAQNDAGIELVAPSVLIRDSEPPLPARALKVRMIRDERAGTQAPR